MRSKNLVIGWLYPELMSTYGDRGNIIVLEKRCQWRGINIEIKKLDVGFAIDDLRECDMLFMGGAQDTQQKIVAEDLKKKASALREMIEDGIPGLYICGAYQFLGKYYKEADGTVVDGLGILDLYTINPGLDKPRLIGNVVVELQIPNTKYQIRNTIVGFENHGGRTYLGKGVKPLGRIVKGFGNNGDLPAMQDGKALQAGDRTEGAVYKNSFGSYFHGPILPKNPHFADLLIKLALERKYLPANATHKALQAGGKEVKLEELDDFLEQEAHKTILKRLGI